MGARHRMAERYQDYHPHYPDQEQRSASGKGPPGHVFPGCSYQRAKEKVYHYPTYLIDTDAIDARIVPWMTAFWGLDGMLYWEVIFEHCPWDPDSVSPDPWIDPLTVRTPLGNGDGLLIYPPKPGLADCPTASLRLKMLRQGLQDYEWLVMLRPGATAQPGEWSDPGMQELRERVSQITRQVNDFDRNPELLEQVRRTTGQRIEQLMQRGVAAE